MHMQLDCERLVICLACVASQSPVRVAADHRACRPPAWLLAEQAVRPRGVSTFRARPCPRCREVPGRPGQPVGWARLTPRAQDPRGPGWACHATARGCLPSDCRWRSPRTSGRGVPAEVRRRRRTSRATAGQTTITEARSSRPGSRGPTSRFRVGCVSRAPRACWVPPRSRCWRTAPGSPCSRPLR